MDHTKACEKKIKFYFSNKRIVPFKTESSIESLLAPKNWQHQRTKENESKTPKLVNC